MMMAERTGEEESEQDDGTLGKVVELWVAAAMQRCSATEQF